MIPMGRDVKLSWFSDSFFSLFSRKGIWHVLLDR